MGNNNVEQLKDGDRNSAELIDRSIENLGNIEKKQEIHSELSPRDIESRVEKAKTEALEMAISVESGGKEKESKSKSQSVRRGKISRESQEKSYKQTMKKVQAELPYSNRIFSNFIHNKAIEKTSEIVGNTIARPNAILAGSFFSFTLTLLVYTTAKTIGYRLSGFETIATFTLGWMIGILYDYIRLLITGKK